MEILALCIYFLLLGLTILNPILGIYNLLYLAYIRPQDHYSSLLDFRPALVTLIITMISFAIHQVVQRKPWVKAPQNKAILALLCLIVLSRLWAINIDNWQSAMEDFLRVCLVYFMIINLVTTPKKLKFFYLYIVFIYLFVAVRFYYNYKWGGNIWSEGSKPGDLSYGFMANADDLGIGMAIALPYVLIPIFYNRNYLYKMLAGVAALLFCLSVLGTQSRGAAIGILWSFIISILSQIRWKKLKKRHYFVGASMVVILFTLFLINYRWTLLEYKEQIMMEDDPGRVGREATWEAGKQMIIHRPILGVGRGQYVAYWENNLPSGVFGVQAAHNILVEVTAELGIIGLIFYLCFSLYGLRQAQQLYQKYGDLIRSNGLFDMLFTIHFVALSVFYINGQFITVAFYWHLYILIALFVCTRNVFLTKIVPMEKSSKK